MWEVTNEPPVALFDQEYEYPEEEEREEDNAGTVVPAAFHYWVHLSLFFSRLVSEVFSLLTL